MWSTRGMGLAAGLAIALLLPAGARANHQAGEIETKVFKATIDASGTFSSAGAGPISGEWQMTASPFWKVVYPDLPVTLSGEAPIRPAADYSFSAATAGTVTWTGTTQYNFETAPPEGFTCTSELFGPPSAGPPFTFANLVQGQGDNVKFELSALNQFGINGQGSCSPFQSTGFAPWGVTLGNNTEVFTTIPREELFEGEEITKAITNGPSNQQPTCTTGCTTPTMSWSGTLKLEKNCRNFAGTATTFSSGPITVTNPFCESECNVADCSQADLQLIPLARAAKEDGGEVDFAVSCYGEQTCTGKQLLQAAGGARTGIARAEAKLGSGSFGIEPASHAQTQIKLSRAGKKVLRREGKIKATLKSTLEGEEVAEPATDSLKVTIK